MKTVTVAGQLIGSVEYYRGNKPSERWVAYRPRQAGDNGTFPRRNRRFALQREAVAWLEAQHKHDASATMETSSDTKR